MAATLGEPVEGNEFIRRTEIRAHQPDILLTNYRGLGAPVECGRRYRTLFSPSLRFWSWTDPQLPRRSRDRNRLSHSQAQGTGWMDEGKLRCIGTSATVSKEPVETRPWRSSRPRCTESHSRGTT